ncbi:DUF397 domain-containing protein [Streptomyces sp. PTD5-9]|uniref:DUF397 domain-containing protein n=1 Tax=Streptomyces sp. PTD5-9 TaxID=3120150 RepID=UPI003007FD27
MPKSPNRPWQRSSYCGEGESCVHVAAPTAGTVWLTESGDPAGPVLRTTPGAWAAFVRTVKQRPAGRSPEASRPGARAPEARVPEAQTRAQDPRAQDPRAQNPQGQNPEGESRP